MTAGNAKRDTQNAAMKADAIRAHWKDWAVNYGTDLRATTLASSIKRLEVDALRRAIEKTSAGRAGASILEVGCGNGQNIVALAGIFNKRGFTWIGIDYVPEMIESARLNATDKRITDHTEFLIGDVLQLSERQDLKWSYDVVFTNRLLINLDTIEKQRRGIEQLAQRTSYDGALILIENSRQTKDAQNDLRETVGLPRRKDADFNLFLDDEVVIPHLESLFSVVEIEDFGSLHDILLYVLLPATLGDAGHYDHPLMVAVADLCSQTQIPAGRFGQNRLYYCSGRRRR